MEPVEIPPYVNASATVVVVVVLLLFVGRALSKWSPWHPRLATVALILVGIVVFGTLVELVDKDPGMVAVGWVGLGLPTYLIRRWVLSADDRAAREDRLRQARRNERRRAPPPLPPGQGPSPGGAP